MFKHCALSTFKQSKLLTSNTHLQSTLQKRQESFSQATADILLARACTRSTAKKRLTFSNALYSDFNVHFSTQ